MTQKHKGKRLAKSPGRRENRRAGGRQQTRGSAKDGVGPLFLYGLHTVRAALDNPDREVSSLHATPSALQRLGKCANRLERSAVKTAETRDLDRMVSAEAVHQGVVLECSPLDEIDESELFHLAEAKLLVVLDQITDPHNVGAILRSAVAMKADAVLVTRRKSASETAVLAKSASGAVDMISTVQIRNLSKAIEELNGLGFATLGLDSEGRLTIEDSLRESRPQKIAIVLGAEGKGLREQTRDACSALVRLDMPGAIRSLNVSNAAVLALYVSHNALET